MICHEKKIIFIHIPNTGGTSIETAFVGQNWYFIESNSKHLDWIDSKKKYSQYWESYYKFSVVRNPWDWMVALYHTHGKDRGTKDCAWRDYLSQPFLAPWEPTRVAQHEIMGPELNSVLRFEHLDEDFATLCRAIKVEPIPLPHVQRNKIRKHYSAYYTEEEIEIVRESQQRDIRRFGYEFEIYDQITRA